MPHSDNLAADQKIGVDLLAELIGFTKHVNPAVDTRIRPAAIAELRLLDQIEIVVGLTDHRQRNVERSGSPRGRLLAASENRLEVQGMNFDPLLLHNADRQTAIESPGK